MIEIKMSDYHAMNLLDTDTKIDWWDKHRSICNVVIAKFNKWQIEGWSEDEIRSLLFDIEMVNKTATKGSPVVIECLIEMLDYIKDIALNRYGIVVKMDIGDGAKTD